MKHLTKIIKISAASERSSFVPIQVSSSRIIRSGTAAFTLVEMLITLAIVLTLCSLLIPSFKSMIVKCQGMGCVHNMRQLGAALWSFAGEHNGWFPPGYALAPSAIKPEDAMPGMPSQMGSNLNLNVYLVPTYLAAMPVCPGLRLTEKRRKQVTNERMTLQMSGGGYAVNSHLTQWKPNAWPIPNWPANRPQYSASRTIFLLENSGDNPSLSWNFIHQNNALTGSGSFQGRSHGNGDTLNFMFLDGHIETISRNDTRDVEDGQKSWTFPTNKNGRFVMNPWGDFEGHYACHSTMSNVEFRALHPEYYPAP